MRILDDLRTEVWYPDFSGAGLESPVWTRVLRGREVVTNSLEDAGWLDNPVEVILCDACGTRGCGGAGYVHVSRLDRYVLWSAPQETDPEQEWPRLRLGTPAIPFEIWDGWAATIRGVPPAERLPPASHAAVADAWVYGPGRTTGTIAGRLREDLVGGDTLEKDDAIALVERFLGLLRAHAAEPFPHPLRPLGEARLETLYFDGPAELDWPAFAFEGDEILLALDRTHVTRIDTVSYE